MPIRLNRRTFLAGVAGWVGCPYIVPASARGRDGAVAPSERIAIAGIGVGGRGQENLKNFMGHKDCVVVAACDVDADRRRQTRDFLDRHYGAGTCATYHDYHEILARDDIDAVLIASPDQWHVIQAAAAARAGKDIYLEKPLSLSVEQNRLLRETVNRYGRVFQFGTQQRSDARFRHGCELVLNARIGTLEQVVVSTPASRAVGCHGPSSVPKRLDWDTWVGPASWMPYTQGIVGNCGEWGHISSFSLGWITTWGIHHVDILQWGNGTDGTGPVEIAGAGDFPADGLYDCATAWDMTLRYASGVVARFVDKAKAPQGVRFIGPDGWVFVKRGFIDAYPKSLLTEPIGPGEIRLPASNDHWRNFLDCVKSRGTPVSSIESAVRTDTICHLCDIAMRLGRTLRWNPAAEAFEGDTPANRMLHRALRSPWHL